MSPDINQSRFAPAIKRDEQNLRVIRGNTAGTDRARRWQNSHRVAVAAYGLFMKESELAQTRVFICQGEQYLRIGGK